MVLNKTKVFSTIFYFFVVVGSRIFSPPEYIEHNKYYAEEATVWSLGIVLFCLVIGNIPFIDEDDILNAEDFVHAQLSFRGGLSRGG